MLSALKRPACQNSINPAEGALSHCPECGATGLEASDPSNFKAFRKTCGKDFGDPGKARQMKPLGRKERKYKIKACTNCGLLINVKGL